MRVGLLFSRSGSYALLGQAMHAGALLAISEINDSLSDVTLEPVTVDPGGRIADYVDGARQLLLDGITHVVGCYTSSSRKEVLPLFEKHDALLWYPSHYEGFETSENVVYTGAAPNQHIVPLTRYLLESGRRRAWLVGSNYVWAWENNRIMREAVLAAGGEIAGERYFPVGDTDLQPVVEQILDAAPDFVFNTMIGASSYAFFRIAARGGGAARHRPAAGDAGRELQPVRARTVLPRRRRPTGTSPRASISPTVDSRATPASSRHGRRAGPTSVRPPRMPRPPTSRYTCWRGRSPRPAAPASRRCAAPSRPSASTRRRAWSGSTRKTGTPTSGRRIGLSQADGTFRIVAEYPAAVRPDPYLVWEAPRDGPARRASPLRLVS